MSSLFPLRQAATANTPSPRKVDPLKETVLETQSPQKPALAVAQTQVVVMKTLPSSDRRILLLNPRTQDISKENQALATPRTLSMLKL
jgi:hypothetical protein